MSRLLMRTLFAFCCAAAFSAHAQLTIEIIGGGATTIPIAIVPFAGESNYPLGVSGIVGADLSRSGLFRLVDPGGVVPRPARAEDVRYGDWTGRGADAVVVGSMVALPDGRTEVRFTLLDAVKQAQLASFSYVVPPAQFRATAHRIADVIYEKLTGDVGVFSTRIAYVAKQGTRYELLVADADGYNPQSIVTSKEPLLSPEWSPDGTRIAYVSMENRKPVVYVQSLTTGARQLVANFRGSNSAPAWAPDGRSLLFTSDRGGSPQIYRLSLSGGAVERMTYDGNYNVSPRFLPDGKGFVFVRRDTGRLNIALQDFATRQVQILTQGSLDESPSVAPNGKLILYASEVGGRGILAAVSSDGRVQQRLTATASDVREPAWGPLQK